MREWILLIARKKLAALRESPPVWLPAYAIAEGKPLRVASVVALTLGLLRELSGEAHLERAKQLAINCECVNPTNGPKKAQVNLLAGGRVMKPHHSEEEIYVAVTERRFKGVNRCC